MATLTITIDDAHVPRIQAAFQPMLDPEVLPTAEDIRQYLVNHLRQVVLEQERVAAAGDILDGIS